MRGVKSTAGRGVEREVEAFSFDAWGRRRAPTLAQLEGLLGARGTLGVYQRGKLTTPTLALKSLKTMKWRSGRDSNPRPPA